MYELLKNILGKMYLYELIKSNPDDRQKHAKFAQRVGISVYILSLVAYYMCLVHDERLKPRIVE